MVALVNCKPAAIILNGRKYARRLVPCSAKLGGLTVGNEHVREHREMPSVQCGHTRALQLGRGRDQRISQPGTVAPPVVTAEEPTLFRLLHDRRA